MTRRLSSLLLAIAVIAGCDASVPSPSTAPAATATPAAPAAPTSPTAGPSSTPAVAPSPSPTPSPNPTPSPTSAASPGLIAGADASPAFESPGDLVVGDCYDPIEDSDDGTLLAAHVRPCSEPHAAEVFGLGELPGGRTAPFPGQDGIDSQATELCDGLFEAYVGIPFLDSDLGYVYFTPTASTWAGGDRLVLCVAHDEGRPITGSLTGSRR